MSSAIKARIPSCIVLKNQIPKEYVDHDIYFNLIPNEEENHPYYDQVPRVGAFEVSFRGALLFSKLTSGKWPSIPLVADKCCNALDDKSLVKEAPPGQYQPIAKSSPPKGGKGSVSPAKQAKKAPVAQAQPNAIGAISQAKEAQAERRTSITKKEEPKKEEVKQEEQPPKFTQPETPK